MFNTFKFIKNNRALQFIALFFIIQNVLFSEILTNVNDKYFWVNRESLIDSAKIDSVILFAEENNLNKIFFQVRGRGDALYESQIVPKYEKIDSLFDPLSYIINITENKDIEVHAWFNTYILWSSPSMPKDSLHFYYLCPECFATDFNGKSDKSINLNQNQSANWEGVFLSPLNMKVNNHILMVIDELINSYNIDGLHLDYIRFQDMFYGYNNEGLDNRWNRHLHMAEYSRSWALNHGQELFPEKGCESSTLTCIKNVKQWDINHIYKELLKRGFRMDRGYGSLKGKVFRIPHMGNVYMDDLKEYLETMDEVICQ